MQKRELSLENLWDKRLCPSGQLRQRDEVGKSKKSKRSHTNKCILPSSRFHNTRKISPGGSLKADSSDLTKK